MADQLQAFKSYIDKNGPVPPHVPRLGQCWVWIGRRHASGYGLVGVGVRKVALAHRAAWMLFKGKDPGVSYICHKCDNRLCVRPGHLFRGTHLDNIKDCVSKGRHKYPVQYGTNCHNHVMTEALVLRGRKLRRKGYSWRTLGAMLGVKAPTARMAILGKNWAWLK